MHVFVLAGLVATPTLLVTDAQFFIGRGASGADVVAVAVIVVLAAPATLALVGLLAGMASPRLGWVVQLLLVAVLVALLLSQILYPSASGSSSRRRSCSSPGWPRRSHTRALRARAPLVCALTPLPFIVLVFVSFSRRSRGSSSLVPRRSMRCPSLGRERRS